LREQKRSAGRFTERGTGCNLAAFRNWNQMAHIEEAAGGDPSADTNQMF
jgi:hypothetical protein